MKIKLDKYYTPVVIANHCIDRVIQILGNEFSEVIEPSVGSGAFLNHSNLHVHFAYDLQPECKTNGSTIVIEGDFLSQDINYLPGRLVIGNPPYGERMYLAQRFFKKSVSIGDYVAFILPISQLNNCNSLYEFDLIYSEDLGEQCYSGANLHCCFNIYKRPKNGECNSKPKKKLKDIAIFRQDKSNYQQLPFDVRLCYWGNGSAGKILNDQEHYSAEYKIKINLDDTQLKEKVLHFIQTFDWREYVNCIAMKKIQQFHIVEVLQKEFPWLK